MPGRGMGVIENELLALAQLAAARGVLGRRGPYYDKLTAGRACPGFAGCFGMTEVRPAATMLSSWRKWCCVACCCLHGGRGEQQLAAANDNCFATALADANICLNSTTLACSTAEAPSPLLLAVGPRLQCYGHRDHGACPYRFWDFPEEQAPCCCTRLAKDRVCWDCLQVAFLPWHLRASLIAALLCLF